jgi:hypothetical protein
MIEPYERIANAIVLYTVSNYRRALRYLKINPQSQATQIEKESLEHFFHPDWYHILTNVDSELLIKKLNEESEQTSKKVTK